MLSTPILRQSLRGSSTRLQHALRHSSRAVSVRLAKSRLPRSTLHSVDFLPDHLRSRVRVLDVPSDYSNRIQDKFRGRPHSFLLYRGDGEDLSHQHPKRQVDIPGTGHQSPMLNWVQVVSTPTADTPGACILLHFDNRRYIFGHIAEGTQRSMNQRKVGLSKLDEIFLTGPVTWKNVGGLLGMILTIADVTALQGVPDDNAKKLKKKKDQGLSTIPSLKIHGAENINQVLATARRFIFRKGLPLKLQEIRHNAQLGQEGPRDPDFEDANVKVWSVSLKPEGQAKPHGRKRSHDDMVAEENAESNATTQNAEEVELNRKIVKSVVDHMFDSNWELDAMVETPLHKVKFPATVFVKGDDGKLKKYEGPMPGDLGSVPDIPVLTRTPWPATKIQQLPPTSPSTQCICYIVKSQPRRGKFNVQEAQKLGVAKPDYKKLTAGETVKGKDGIDVTPEMCVGKTIEGHGFVVVDLPDVSYVEPFLARVEWSTDSLMKTMDVMHWILGPGVVKDPRIQAFMKDRQSMRHRVFSPDASPNYVAMESAAGNLIRCHRIDPERFPLPVYSNKSDGQDSELFETARTGAKVQLAPRVIFQDEEVIPLMDTLGPLNEMDQDVVKMADEARTKLSDPAFLANIENTEKDIPNRDVEIIPLGTGSALPSKYRNVSATIIRVPGSGAYLFDCGENTLGQLRRMYGYAGADEILRELKVIWISHLHADHHLGTASVIKAWRDATADDQRPPKLAVASHVNMLDWLREYADIEDYGFDRLRLVEIRGHQQRESKQNPFIANATLAREMGITRIDAARVDHCHGALACVFTWPSGLRIAYSGDCRPSPMFAEIARGCTLLIHESTLDDELRGDALAKKHCTMSEALGVARDMRARRVLLTHFSQRYPKIANASSSSEGGGVGGVKDQVVLMAFDQMCIKLGDFKKAELFLPALRKLYEEGGEDELPKLD